MKKLLRILILALPLIAGCKPKEPEIPISATLMFANINLPYGESDELAYSLKNAAGDVTVTCAGLPTEIEYKVKGNKEGGVITFKSLLDEDKNINVKITFSDGHSSVTKDLLIVTTEDPKLTVNLESDTVHLSEGIDAVLKFSAINCEGNLKVLFDGLKDIISRYEYDKSSGKGVIYMSTISRTPAEYNVTVVFKDNKMSVEMPLLVVIDEYSEEPTDIITDIPFTGIYPAGSGIPTEFTFTVKCKTAVDEVTVTTGEAVSAALELSDDKMSGKVTLTALKGLNSPETVTITASNRRGQKSETLTFDEASIKLSCLQLEVSSDKTTRTALVNANVPFKAVADKACDGWLTVTSSADDIVFEFAENDSWTGRSGNVVISDINDIIKINFPVNQAGSNGTHESDIAALMAIYESLNMKEWIDYGAHGIYYKNWGTDAPPCDWLGLRWTGILDGSGRCTSIDLTGEQPNSTGIISEEIGKLTELKNLVIFPKHKFRNLPNNIRNLLNLEEINFVDNDMNDIDISEWTGLADLMKNPANHMKNIGFANTGLHGTVPEWAANLPDTDPNITNQFNFRGCHFSGQVPDKVVKHHMWSGNFSVAKEYVENNPRFDKTKYEMTPDGWDYIMTFGEAMIYTQLDNYALWVGERPSNTKWVDDKFGGHWEWTK